MHENYAFYTTILRGDEIMFAAGPYPNWELAADKIPAVADHAVSVNPAALFYEYGVTRVAGEPLPVGCLNFVTVPK